MSTPIMLMSIGVVGFISIIVLFINFIRVVDGKNLATMLYVHAIFSVGGLAGLATFVTGLVMFLIQWAKHA